MKLCAYRNCTNSSCTASHLTYFALPNDSRRNVWIINSGNPDLLSIGHEKNFIYFCEQHFEDKHLMKSGEGYTELCKGAVPILFVDSFEIFGGDNDFLAGSDFLTGDVF